MRAVVDVVLFDLVAVARVLGLATTSISVSSSTAISSTSIRSVAFLDGFCRGSAFAFPLEVALPFTGTSTGAWPFFGFFSGGITKASSSAGAWGPYRSSESDGSGDVLLFFRLVPVVLDAGFEEGPAVGPFGLFDRA